MRWRACSSPAQAPADSKVFRGDRGWSEKASLRTEGLACRPVPPRGGRPASRTVKTPCYANGCGIPRAEPTRRFAKMGRPPPGHWLQAEPPPDRKGSRDRDEVVGDPGHTALTPSDMRVRVWRFERSRSAGKPRESHSGGASSPARPCPRRIPSPAEDAGGHVWLAVRCARRSGGCRHRGDVPGGARPWSSALPERVLPCVYCSSRVSSSGRGFTRPAPVAGACQLARTAGAASSPLRPNVRVAAASARAAE